MNVDPFETEQLLSDLDNLRNRVVDLFEQRDEVVTPDSSALEPAIGDAGARLRSAPVLDEVFDGTPNRGKGRPAPRRKPENEIVRDGIGYLRSVGYARKVHGGAMGNIGEPDVDACVRGRTVKLEAKAGSNKPKAVQLAALNRWAKVGALVGWFTTTQHIVELLDHLDDKDYVTDLSAPGCARPCHREAS